MLSERGETASGEVKWLQTAQKAIAIVSRLTQI